VAVASDPHFDDPLGVASDPTGGKRNDATDGTTRPTDTAVAVPVKSFALAKGRLADTLSGPERAALARSMAATVVGAASNLPVFVATDDNEVAAWATEQDLLLLNVSVTGLNAVAAEVVGMLADRGYRYAMICHADLPLARDLDAVAGFPGVTIVPDRHGDGTNVIVIPTASGFRFRYGPASARHHRHEAARLGLAMRWLRLPHLAWDIDVPDDLDILHELGDIVETSSPTDSGFNPRDFSRTARRPAP
jgi:2-phospho-L-lactate guanylyltransferase